MAYTAAPFQDQEHGANAFNPGNDEDDCFVVPTSFMVTADHDPGRDGGGPLGWRFCRSGSMVVGNYPKLTWRTPMRHDTENVGGGTSDVVQLAEQTSD